jgi:hypothetical protein
VTRRKTLLALYAVLVIASYAVTALPGLPYFESDGARNFAVAVDLTLFVLIARGSKAAWVTTLALGALIFLFVLLGSAGPPEPGVFGVLALRACALGVLVLLAPLVVRRHVAH